VTCRGKGVLAIVCFVYVAKENVFNEEEQKDIDQCQKTGEVLRAKVIGEFGKSAVREETASSKVLELQQKVDSSQTEVDDHANNF